MVNRCERVWDRPAGTRNPTVVVVLCGWRRDGSLARRRSAVCPRWGEVVLVRRCRVLRCGLGAVMDLSPAEQDVLVGHADHERGQQRLSHAAVRESVHGIADIDVVALDPAVDAFGVGSDALVGVLPVGGEVAPVLTELVFDAEVVGAQRDGRLLADAWSSARGRGRFLSLSGSRIVGLAAMWAARWRALARSTAAGEAGGVGRARLRRGQVTEGEGPAAGHCSRIRPWASALCLSLSQ